MLAKKKISIAGKQLFPSAVPNPRAIRFFLSPTEESDSRDLWSRSWMPIPLETSTVRVHLVRSPHKIAFCVTHDSWQRNEIKIHDSLFTEHLLRSVSASPFSFLSPSLSLFHYIPLVSSTCSSFRKTQPPRKTILSHNLRLLQ